MFIVKNRYCEEAGEGEGGGEGPTAEELQAKLAEYEKSIEGLKAKNDELLGETKKAKALRREAEEIAKREAEEKAKAAGDYEQLHKSAMQELEKERAKIAEITAKQAAKDIKINAMKIAGELADGTNAELLSEFVAKRLSYSEGDIKVTDADGNLTISSTDDLKNEIKGDARFAALLKGSQSSGGGASGGGSNGGGAAKNIKLTSTQKIAEGLRDTGI